MGVLAAGCGSSPPARTGARRAGAQALAYSRCMRSHGVPSFPDPSQGAFNLPSDINQSALQTTIQKCQVNGLPINIS